MQHFPWWLFFLFALSASVAQAQPPRSDGDYLHRGVARFAKGDLDGAIADFDRANAKGPRVGSNGADDSDARSVRGDLKEIIINRGRSLAIIPLAAACRNRGLVRLPQGHDAEAEKDFADYIAPKKEMGPALEEKIRAAKLQRAQKLAGPNGDYEAGGQGR